MRSRLGFTLIELISVILLIGILAVTALPKLSIVNNSSALIEASDRLTSLLRHSQLQSMQNTQTLACYKVILSASRFGQQSSNCTSVQLATQFSPDYLGFSEAEANSAKLSIQLNNTAIASNTQITFNSLGVPQNACANGCQIKLELNSQSRIIYIEPQGYIHL